MITKVLNWLGLGDIDGHSHGGHGHAHHGAGEHGHKHGVIDPALTTTEQGIRAIKWSFVILAITAAFQLAIVFVSGSVALLADTIHNIGDATTAIPLWVAFVLARRKPSKTFCYGLGRAEDLAGMLIVLIILFSAIVAGYQAIERLMNPQPVQHLGWLTAAGIIGFLGNEIVAIFRIRVGRRMNSTALIVDGYHARTDGLTSLAVVLGAAGVWLGYPPADPIVGLLITIAIFGIVLAIGARSDHAQPRRRRTKRDNRDPPCRGACPGYCAGRRRQGPLDRAPAPCGCRDRCRRHADAPGRARDRKHAQAGAVRARAGAAHRKHYVRSFGWLTTRRSLRRQRMAATRLRAGRVRGTS